MSFAPVSRAAAAWIQVLAAAVLLGLAWGPLPALAVLAAAAVVAVVTGRTHRDQAATA